MTTSTDAEVLTAGPDMVRVWSVLPHDLSVSFFKPKGSGKGKTVIEETFTLKGGDNLIKKTDWTRMKKRSSIKSRLEAGTIGVGRFVDLPSLTRDQLWSGERDSNDRPVLTAPGHAWIGRMSPMAATRTDKGMKKRAARLGIQIISETELAELR